MVPAVCMEKIRCFEGTDQKIFHCIALQISLSLLNEDACRRVTILNYTICTDGEIWILVNFCPKVMKRFCVKDNISIDGDIDQGMVSSE